MLREHLSRGEQVVRPSGVVTTSRRNLGFQNVSRQSARASATQLQEAVTSTSWYSHPERFISIQQPSKDAKALERAFWHHPVVDVPSTREEAVVMIECLQRETEAHGLADGTNVVAFTGGNGPALTAYLLDSIFDGAVIGCIGNESLVTEEQRTHASYVCDLLGIDLLEVDDATWNRFGSAQKHVSETALGDGIVLFNGFTADDAFQHSKSGRYTSSVCAPLSNLSHAAVNALSRVVGLPTMNLSNY